MVEDEVGRPGATARVALGAVRHNYALAAARAGDASVIAVVKADAYGHGAVPVARTLVEAGCPLLAVWSVEEGAALRDAGLRVPVLVLGGPGDLAEAETLAGRHLVAAVHHGGHLAWLAEAAGRRRERVPVHVEVDTGMRRMGVLEDEALALLESADGSDALALEGVFTHFARADEPDLGPSLEQAARFRRVLEAARERGIRPRWVHAANSAGLLAGKALAEALPEANAVRPGLMLYGASPAPHFEADLRPAMRMTARVAHVRRVAPGEAVGYAALFRAERETRVATLALGYADGVPIAASNRGEVMIRGRRLPMVGRVSMDYVGVDCGDVPVEVGDEAVLFGAPGLGVEDAARAADTLSYELLVRVGPRVRRVWAE